MKLTAVRVDAPVEELEVAAFTVPTDAPEADGTLAWSETAMVVVRVTAAGQAGLGWTYASPAAQSVVTGMLAGVVDGRDAMDVARGYKAILVNGEMTWDEGRCTGATPGRLLRNGHA